MAVREVSESVGVKTVQRQHTPNAWDLEVRKCDDLHLAIWAQQCERAIALSDGDSPDRQTAENTRATAVEMLHSIHGEQSKRKRAKFRMNPIEREFDRETLDELRRQIDLVRLIEADGVRLRRSGSTFRGLCPFHDDRNPSFIVWPEDGRFRCFGCGVAGNVITWWQLTHGVSFRHAVIWLARTSGVRLKSRVPAPKSMTGVKLVSRLP